MRGLFPAALLGVLFFVGAPLAQQTADAPRLTGPTPFTKETPAPPMQRQVTDDVRRRRNYRDRGLRHRFERE
jgi:nitrate reductase (cytochrome), electron transfer subunit